METIKTTKESLLIMLMDFKMVLQNKNPFDRIETDKEIKEFLDERY